MTKEEIAWKLWIDHDIWECGYSIKEIEKMRKKDLERWLEDLELEARFTRRGRR